MGEKVTTQSNGDGTGTITRTVSRSDGSSKTTVLNSKYSRSSQGQSSAGKRSETRTDSKGNSRTTWF